MPTKTKPKAPPKRTWRETMAILADVATMPEVIAYVEHTPQTGQARQAMIEKQLAVFDAVHARYPKLTSPEIGKFMSILEGLEKYFA